MPYSYITTGNDYHREPILSGLDEQPLDNDTKEGIYLSTRLVEKQRLEDAKLLEQYNRDCKNTPAYRALQKAKERAAEQYDARIDNLKSRYRRNRDGECFIEKKMEAYQYYGTVLEAFDEVGGYKLRRNYAANLQKSVKDDILGSVTNRRQFELYKKVAELEAEKEKYLEPYNEKFEAAAARRCKGEVKEALRRADLMELSNRIEAANRECAVGDMYAESYRREIGNVGDKTLNSFACDLAKYQSNKFDAVIARAERVHLEEQWEKMESELYDETRNDDGSTNKRKRNKIAKTLEFLDNLADKRSLRYLPIAENGCKPDKVDEFVKSVDTSVACISDKIQSGDLPISVLEALAYDPSSYDVQIEKVAPGTKVHNKLENADYVTDENRCFVVTGTAGEQWPVNGDKLKNKYGIDPDTVKEGEQTVAHVNGGSDGIWAVPVTGNHKIETSWGDVLETNAEGVEHGDGDYIVSNTPDFSDAWVVNGAVFGNTYEESEANSFVGKAFDSVASKTAPDDSDDMVDSIVASSSNSKYETFKNKDGNQCRRNRATGETTVWVEGYDRVRKGKVEHVKSYWKVLHK